MSTVDSGGSPSFYGCDPIVPAAHRFGSTSAIGMAAKPLLLRRRGGKTDAVRRVPRCDRPGCDGQDARLVQNRACAARLEQA